MKLELRLLADTATGHDTLRRLYTTVMVDSFPHPDERETLPNLHDALSRNLAPNQFHVVVALDRDEPRGGAVFDYLASPNVGVIEFLAVARRQRGQGLGRALYERILEMLAADARAAGNPAVAYVLAEVADPSQVEASESGKDSRSRLGIFGRMGYRRLDLDYVQPPLSKGQSPARHLLLVARPFQDEAELSARNVLLAIHEYIRLAMRIADPARDCPEYLEMAAQLRGRSTVRLLALER